MHSNADLYPDAQSVALKRIIKEALDEKAKPTLPLPSIPSSSFYQRAYLNPARDPANRKR